MRLFNHDIEFLCVIKPLILLIGAVVIVSPVWVHSDDSQPVYIQITEQQTAQASESPVYQMRWRVPITIDRRNAPKIVLPSQCQPITTPGNGVMSFAERQRWYRCETGLAGQVLSVTYPLYPVPNATLIKYVALNGEQHTRLMATGESSWQIPHAETQSRVAMDYTLLGIQHIWAGTDHLLFLLCLLWIAGNLRSVMITITGFTVAHSITLVLSALQWVRLPVIPVEAVIALSIVFLACEIQKNNKNTLTWRHPIAVSSSFGLLHGFGFAAALAEIGLPQTELVTGLLFFNVGVEIGQVVFAIAAVLMIVLIKRFIAPRVAEQGLADVSRVLGAYCIGGVASFWLVERCMNMFGPIAAV